jgi:hypothetical protein
MNYRLRTFKVAECLAPGPLNYIHEPLGPFG